MWGAIIAAGASLLGSYMNKKSADKATDQAAQSSALSRELYEKARDSVTALTPPNLASMLEPLQRAVSLGEMTPEEYVAQVQEATNLAGIKIPQKILDAQYTALAKMQEIADEGGLTATDRAKLENIKTDIATQEQGKRSAIMQDAARRGISGSGLEEMSRIANQQGAATRASQMGFDVAADAEKRALDAIVNSSNMASGLRNQEYTQQSDAAKAQDMINKFNVDSANTAMKGNIDARNNAQAANLAQKYRLQEFNIGQQAKDAAARQAAVQDDWYNLFNKTKAAAVIGTNQAGGLANEATNAAKTGAAQNAAAQQGLLTGVGQAVTAYDQWKKTQEPELVRLG